MSLNLSLTVIIPTLNEEDFLSDCLNSCAFVDDIIVIDSFSSDKTEEIAREFNVNFIQRNFDNFSSQKNFALQFAKNDWVLFLDADERITESLKEEIYDVVQKNGEKIVAYELLFRHFFMDRFLKHSGQDYVLRLINKKHCMYGKELVHEKIQVNGLKGRLKSFVPHYTYKSMEFYLLKRNKYATYQAIERLQKAKKVGFLHLVIKPWWRFFNDYFIQLGFLDGYPAYAIKKANAYGVFLRALIMLINTNKETCVAKYFSDYDAYFNKLHQEAYQKAEISFAKKKKTNFITQYLSPTFVWLYYFCISKLSTQYWLRYSDAWLKTYAYILTNNYLWMFNHRIRK